MRLKQDEI